MPTQRQITPTQRQLVRWKVIEALRNDGVTFKKIGDYIATSATRARTLYLQYKYYKKVIEIDKFCENIGLHQDIVRLISRARPISYVEGIIGERIKIRMSVSLFSKIRVYYNQAPFVIPEKLWSDDKKYIIELEKTRSGFNYFNYCIVY